MQKLDAKFSGVIFKIKNGEIVTDDEYMVFLAKDDAFLPTLRFYRLECQKLGAEQAQIDAVDRAIERVIVWRAANPHRLKTPDVGAFEKLVG